MLPEEYEVYKPYAFPYQQGLSTSVGVLDDPAVAHAPVEQDASQPPWYPADPQVSPTPPRKRPGRGGAIMMLTLVLALIFGVGLFAGWEFAGSSSTATT